MADPKDRPAYSFTSGPPPGVSEFFRNKALKPSFSYHDVEPQEHAIQFAVAKAMQIDVLTDIQSALQKAIDDGVPYRKFAAELEPRLRKLGWWGVKEQIDPVTGEARKVRLGSPRRLKTIYRSNMRSARAAGQWDRIERSKAAMPYLIYGLGPSERHRPHHQSKAGLVLPVDDPFWQQWFPPNGWGCKCHVRQITRREAERLGVNETPIVPMRDVLNPRTGEIRQVPSGIDPGWDMNPGLHRLRNMELFLREKLDAADPVIARVAARDIATSWRVLRIFDQAAPGSAPIAMLRDTHAAALGIRSRVVNLDAGAVAEIKASGAKVSDLAKLADLADSAPAFHMADGALILHGGATIGFFATIRRLADGLGLELVDMGPATRAGLRRLEVDPSAKKL